MCNFTSRATDLCGRSLLMSLDELLKLFQLIHIVRHTCPLQTACHTSYTQTERERIRDCVCMCVCGLWRDIESERQS